MCCQMSNADDMGERLQERQPSSSPAPDTMFSVSFYRRTQPPKRRITVKLRRLVVLLRKCLLR
jgi:hypothetical protein